MAGKVILCRCEDVTRADIEHAVASGFGDIEEVKRYTGFGTGPCQGKHCQREVALELARITGRAPEDMQPFTARPLVYPVELKYFARSPKAAGEGPSDE